MSTDFENLLQDFKEKKLTLKLVIDNSCNRVLYAEVNNEVFDFLFNLPLIPVGTLTTFLSNNGSQVGPTFGSCIANIVSSFNNINKAYLLDNEKSNSNSRSSSNSSKTYYCPKCFCYTQVYGTICTRCQVAMTWVFINVQGVPKDVGTNGGKLKAERRYVKNFATYMVMDDLTITVMSTTSAIALLNKFGVKDVSTLLETTAEFQGLELLKAFLNYGSALTIAFFGSSSVAAAVKKERKE